MKVRPNGLMWIDIVFFNGIAVGKYLLLMNIIKKINKLG